MQQKIIAIALGDPAGIGPEIALKAAADPRARAACRPLLVRTPSMDYAVFRLADALYVTADLCTHGPGSLSEGYVEGCEVECPFHQGKFDFRTGLPTAPPCDTALRIWTPILIDGQLCIDPNEHRGDHQAG